jgi:imidazolonepropionase-like amidohydrolase
MNGRIRISGGAIVTGGPQGVVQNGIIEIADGRVRAIGRADEFPAPDPEVEIVDARDCTVLPGLIDTHVHVFHEAQQRRLSEGAAALWGAAYVRSALQRGLTTIRDLGCQTDAVFGLKRALAAGWTDGPRLLACGRAICMTGGHGWANLSIEADGADAVRLMARRQIKAGADVVKLMATGGAGTPGELPTQVQLGVEEIRAGVDEAHKAGKPAAAHALATDGILNAIEAGVDTIEHGVFLDERCVERMLRNNVVLTPTISVYPRIAERGLSHGEPAFVVDKARPLISPHMASLKLAVRAGIKIIFGTDSATLYNGLGDISGETSLMVEAGMSAEEVIVSATRTAAEVCGIADDVGTLEPGKRADVLVVQGDALADIGALSNVRWVFRDGRRHAGLTMIEEARACLAD